MAREVWLPLERMLEIGWGEVAVVEGVKVGLDSPGQPKAALKEIAIASANLSVSEPVSVGSVRLSFIVASSFSESRNGMAGEELSLFTANLNVKVVPERFVYSIRLTNKLIVCQSFVFCEKLCNYSGLVCSVQHWL